MPHFDIPQAKYQPLSMCTQVSGKLISNIPRKIRGLDSF